MFRWPTSKVYLARINFLLPILVCRRGLVCMCMCRFNINIEKFTMHCLTRWYYTRHCEWKSSSVVSVQIVDKKQGGEERGEVKTRWQCRKSNFCVVEEGEGSGKSGGRKQREREIEWRSRAVAKMTDPLFMSLISGCRHPHTHTHSHPERERDHHFMKEKHHERNLWSMTI